MDGLDMLDEFRSESVEGLETAEQSLLALEAGDHAGIHEAFRALHTIKGGSGFLDLQNVNKLAHQMENLLDQIRQGSVELTSDMTDALLRGVDRVRTMILSDDCGHSFDNNDLLQVLDQSLSTPATPAPAPTSTTSETTLAMVDGEPAAGSLSHSRTAIAAINGAPVADHFGSFLVTQGVLSCDQLLDALYRQHALATPSLVLLNDEIGIAADACLDLAREARQRGVEVIAWAADQGRIDHSQAAALAEKQRASRPPLGQIIAAMDLVARDEIIEWLAAYHDSKQANKEAS